MNEDRKRILDMLATGKISADEAGMLLDALGTQAGATTTATAASATGSTAAADALGKFMAVPGAPKYLYVTVDGDDKVNVKVPLGLLRAGLKLTSLIPPQAMDEINKSMAESGVSIDFNNLKPEDVEELIENLREMEITVDAADGNRVRVWCE
jgi:hypothetical protein